MLSVVDLIEAGTMTPDLAAYTLAAIGSGASFMVGAMPGGAGKTTVMGALLNFVPPGVQLLPAEDLAVIQRGAGSPEPRGCYICHEVGRGPYYAYLWGHELRAYFDLPAAGHMLATNLHADTCDQARAQVCDGNGVDESSFRRMNLLLFLSVRRSGLGVRRQVEEVWESDGESPHRRIFTAQDKSMPAHSAGMAPVLASAGKIARARAAIDALVTDGVRAIEQVRSALLADWPIG